MSLGPSKLTDEYMNYVCHMHKFVGNFSYKIVVFEPCCSGTKAKQKSQSFASYTHVIKLETECSDASEGLIFSWTLTKLTWSPLLPVTFHLYGRTYSFHCSLVVFDTV